MKSVKEIIRTMHEEGYITTLKDQRHCIIWNPDEEDIRMWYVVEGKNDRNEFVSSELFRIDSEEELIEAQEQLCFVKDHVKLAKVGPEEEVYFWYGCLYKYEEAVKNEIEKYIHDYWWDDVDRTRDEQEMLDEKTRVRCYESTYILKVKNIQAFLDLREEFDDELDYETLLTVAERRPFASNPAVASDAQMSEDIVIDHLDDDKALIEKTIPKTKEREEEFVEDKTEEKNDKTESVDDAAHDNVEHTVDVAENNVAPKQTIKGGSHMFNLMKLNLVTKTISTIPFPSTVALEWADRLGRAEDAFLIVDHSFDKKKNQNAQKNLNHILNNGIRLMNGVKYVWVMAGSSQLRKASSTFIDETLKEEFLRYILCGVDDRRNLVANKTLVYRALSMSSTYNWYSKLPESECFGLVKMPDINKVAVFKDVEVEYEGIFDVVNEMETEFGKKVTVKYKISDGAGYLIIDDTRLNAKQRIELVKALEAFTYRAPGFKGIMIPILKSVFLNWIRYNKLNPIRKDYWGNEVDIRELEFFTFGSSFKWCKCVDSFKGYQKAFKELGHEFRVCVTAHHRKADIPYQQMQTLQLTAEDAKLLAAAGTARMQKLSAIDGVHKLLSGSMKEAVKLYPALLRNKYIFDQANACYLSKYWDIAGGRVPEVSMNPFAAPDTVAVLQGLFGLKPEGVIEGKHVYCGLFDEGKTVDVTRCPHLDNAHCLRKVDLPEDTMIGFFMGSACYFSCNDSTMSNVQMDFDGDHVNVTDNEFIVKRARESIVRLGNKPLYYEAKGSKAAYATDEDIVNLLLNIEPAPVGLYANTLTKIYANGVHGVRDLDRIAVATEGANTCIDAAKYISGDSVEAAGFRGLKLIDRFSGVKLPMYHAYAKSSAFVKGSFEARVEKSEFYPECGLDVYSKTFTDSTSKKLVIDGLDELEFDYSVMMSDACRVVPGLVNVIDSSNKQGIFRDMAREFDTELTEARSATTGMDSVDKDARIDAFTLARCAEIREQILAYAASVGSDLSNTVNYLVRYLFTVKFCPNSMMQLLWGCFGEEIVANIRSNLFK